MEFPYEDKLFGSLGISYFCLGVAKYGLTLGNFLVVDGFHWHKIPHAVRMKL